MDFFSDHLNSKNLANCSDEDVFKKLKGIPLHVSVTRDHKDIPWMDLKYFLLLVDSECMVSSTNEELGVRDLI
jgi:hypothetical protein